MGDRRRGRFSNLPLSLLVPSLLPFTFRFHTESVYNLDMSASGQSVRSLIEGLPPEIAKRVHPDWQKNEVEYWAQRDTLLRQFADQWIGFAEGRVIASGMSPVEVFHAAQASGKHPFVTRVGHENEPNRMRRAIITFGYRAAKKDLPCQRLAYSLE